jgi:hypothetical protein
MVLHHFVVYGAPPASCTCNAGYTAQSGGCSACAANSYKDAQGDVVCTVCPASAESPAAATAVAQCACPLGYTGDAHVGVDCSECPADTFKDSAGAAACTDCPDHAAAPALSDAAGDCACNAGYAGQPPGACELCAPGTYAAVGSTACASCNAEQTSPAGSDALADCECNAGYTGPNGGTCTACAAGTFKNTTGSAACAACPSNSSAPAASDALTDCTCNAGYTGSDGGTCSACPADTYKDATGAAACTSCSAHATAPAASVAATACECDLGYQGGHGTLCQQCPTGTYEDVAAHSCKLCPTHSFSPAGSAAVTACTCNVGHTGPDGGLCEACAPNTYKNTTGSAACTACTPFSTSAAGSDGANDCVCDTGYVKTGVTSCGLICQAGWQMSADGTECQPCPNSYYKAEQGEHMCTRCPAHAMHGLTGQTSVDACYCEQGYLWDAKTCTICPAGTFNNRANESQCFACVGGAGGDHTKCPDLSQAPAGYQATASGENLEPCPVNHYNDGSSVHCEPCPSPSSFSSLGGLTSVAECVCQPGYERVGGVCTACGLGSYKTATGDGPCTPCWAHATTLQTASTSPAHCKCVANYGTNKDCVLCAGHYGPQGDGATLVEPDMAWGCTNGCNCRDLANGISFDELIALNCPLCVPCGPNEFKNVVGGSGLLAWCLPCPNNSTLPIGLSHEPSSCRCDPGFTGNAGSGSGEWYEWHKQPLCTPCPIGFFKPAGGSAACTSCGFNTETAAAASTDVSACACAADYEPGSGGGPDVNGVCVASCPEGSTGAAGTCAQCEQGKFKGRKGQDQCSACTPPRTAARKGSVSKDACACPQNSMGLAPETFHAIDSVGALSTAGLDTTTFSTSTSFPADRAFRLRRLRVSGGAGTQLEVAVDGRVVFACEARDCARTSAVPLFGARGRLDVRVLAGAPQLELERHTRRAVTTTQPPAWWDQAEVERLALARSLQDGDLIFSTRTPFSTTHCQACPRRFNCKAFV